MILLWMEKMKNWLQFFLFVPVFHTRWTKKIKPLFIVPLKEIIFQLVKFFLIWELICFWNQAYCRFIGKDFIHILLFFFSFTLGFTSCLLWKILWRSRNHQTSHWKNSSSLSTSGSNLPISHKYLSKQQIFPIHPW